MKFADYRYARPNLENLTLRFEEQLEAFDKAKDILTLNRIIFRINTLRNRFQSMASICHVRHTVNIKDEYYEKEHNFFNEKTPSVEALVSRFYKKLLDSRFRAELEEQWGKQLFVIAELAIKTFQPSILESLQEENKLSTEYVKSKAVAQISFRGETYNLAGIHVLETDPDRETRKEASTAKWDFYVSNRANAEEIYDKSVKVRDSIAKELGYKNFVELGYARMNRSDYTPEMVANFRKQVHEHIVPIAQKLYERQRKRLNLDKLKYYDEDFKFASGNPKPKGTPEWIVKNAETMYSELSNETRRFFDFMIENELMDLVNKEGKATGGYCTHFGKYKTPFIFSNFNGTSGDIDVLTHEAGHAFQFYSSRKQPISEYFWPTYEACEIHSMSMEFFTWPWMNLFFKEDTDKYQFAHLSASILFLPYGVAVDEFQHFVYEHPEATPEERNAAWRALEKKYLPHRDYDGNQFLEDGCFWQRQNHIFTTPFYYIDYTLAQICAFQFWKRDREDHTGAWNDYANLCKEGGSKSFLELVKVAGLRSPFEDGCLESVVGEISSWLDSIDDSKF